MKIRKTILPLLICLTLSACNTAAVPSEAEETANYSETSQTELQTVTEAEETESPISQTEDQTAANTAEEYKAPLSEKDYLLLDRCGIYPAITEEDIEYMGIPYKDLTLDQFIQMWGQCSREGNVHKQYFLYYNNGGSQGLTEEDRRKYDEEQIKEQMVQKALNMLVGNCWITYHNVKLEELPQSKEFYKEFQGETYIKELPDGYYDTDDSEEKCYALVHDLIMYGEKGSVIYECPNDTVWVNVKKIDGYWKIGIMFDTSPPFFLYQSVESEA
ncbi:MAG: hypothetical protein NC203_06395 [Firmicutes bacterium]|nr:hypothetical protein [[Eubacterium] siraeum]MCM1487976.1 hypothetical protein [Bacillota bacterium]